MGITPRFVHLGYFPQAWCGMGDGSGFGLNFVDNLTLSQVMAFVWSLEGFTITTAGTVSNGTSSINAANTFALAGTGPTMTFFDNGSGSGVWTPGASPGTVWASWPANRIPRERVCAPALGANGLGNIFAISAEKTGDTESIWDMTFTLGTDPAHAGKFRIAYNLFVIFRGRTSPTDDVDIFFWHDSTGMTYSGTMTLGGITFPWYARTGGTGSPVVGTTPSLSGSSSNYTYV